MSNNSHTLHEQLAKSRLTIIAENSPDMTNSKLKTTKYAQVMKSSTGFEGKHRMTKSLDSNGL